jgi:L-lactate dehydrogenase
MNPRKNKVAVIGAGSVGATIAYNLFVRGSVNEIALIDLNREKAEAESQDIEQGMPLGKSVNVYAADFDSCADAEIVILTAGAKQRPGETRIELLDRNVAITSSIVRSIASTPFNGILLVVTNPVDILTFLAWKISGYPAERVFGSGTVLDTSRLRGFLSVRCDVNPQNIHGYVLGEHGNTSFPAWSTVSIGGLPIEQYLSMRNDVSQGSVAQIKQDAKTYVREAAYSIIRGKGSTFYAIGQAVGTIVDTILRDERRIMPVSTVHHDFPQFPETAYSYPAVIGGRGIIYQLQYRLTEEELRELAESVGFIADNISKVESMREKQQ